MLSHDEKAIQLMRDFVEGKVDIETFKCEFDNNPVIKLALANDPLCPPNIFYPLSYRNIVHFLEVTAWSKISEQCSVWRVIQGFLSRYSYPLSPTTHYVDRHVFLLNIQPSWLDITDDDFLSTHVISQIPEGLTKAKRIAWCKARLKELFRYDKSPPRWIQSAEWPILGGKPLVFRKQINNKADNERVDYIFYCPETGEEHIVTQWY